MLKSNPQQKKKSVRSLISLEGGVRDGGGGGGEVATNNENKFDKFSKLSSYRTFLWLPHTERADFDACFGNSL